MRKRSQRQQKRRRRRRRRRWQWQWRWHQSTEYFFLFLHRSERYQHYMSRTMCSCVVCMHSIVHAVLLHIHISFFRTLRVYLQPKPEINREINSNSTSNNDDGDRTSSTNNGSKMIQTCISVLYVECPNVTITK